MSAKISISKSTMPLSCNKSILALTLVLLQSTLITSQTARKVLSDALLTNYDSNIRPYCGNNELTNTSIDIALRQLVDLKWNDCQLTWNPSDYSNISHIVFPYKKIWIPDIVLYDSVAGEFDGLQNYRADVKSDGTVSYNFPTVIECSCKINVRYFPFDTQSCVMEFGSWVYHGLELDIFPKNLQGDMGNLLANSEWNFVSFQSNRVVSYFGCCPEPFPVVKFTLKIQRKSLYYVMNLFIPTIVIALLGIFAFILPVEAGEKVGLEITVMLSLAVFLLLIGDSLPPSSDNFPLIGHYFAFTMVLVGFATIMTVFVLNTYYKENANMPKWVRFVFLEKIGRLVRVTGGTQQKEKENEEKANSSMKRNQVQDTTEIISLSSSVIRKDKEKSEQEKSNEEDSTTVPEDWKTLSIILDRTSCVIYILATIIGSIAIFAPLASPSTS